MRHYKRFFDRQKLSAATAAELLTLEPGTRQRTPGPWRRWAAAFASLALLAGVGLGAATLWNSSRFRTGTPVTTPPPQTESPAVSQALVFNEVVTPPFTDQTIAGGLTLTAVDEAWAAAFFGCEGGLSAFLADMGLGEFALEYYTVDMGPEGGFRFLMKGDFRSERADLFSDVRPTNSVWLEIYEGHSYLDEEGWQVPVVAYNDTSYLQFTSCHLNGRKVTAAATETGDEAAAAFVLRNGGKAYGGLYSVTAYGEKNARELVSKLTDYLTANGVRADTPPVDSEGAVTAAFYTSLEEAREEETFGAYLPLRYGLGWAAENFSAQVLRDPDKGERMLLAWQERGGDGSVRMEVTRCPVRYSSAEVNEGSALRCFTIPLDENGMPQVWTERSPGEVSELLVESGLNLVDVKEPQRYDDRLYAGGEIPEEYRENFQSPVTFRAEEVTPDAIAARTRTRSGGETDCVFRLLFSGLTVVTYDFRNVTAEEVWLLLSGTLPRGEDAALGYYTLDAPAEEGDKLPTLLVVSSGFVSDWAENSSHTCAGSYVVRENKLIACCARHLYVFEIVDKDTLRFVAGESDPPARYTPLQVEDGALFRCAMTEEERDRLRDAVGTLIFQDLEGNCWVVDDTTGE